MIAKAKSISHGVNSLRYISGESASKTHPDKIFHVASNFLDPSLDSCAIYDMMAERCRNHPKMKNNVIRIELSPQQRYTKDFTMDDWRQLWNDYINAFDCYTHTVKVKDMRTGKFVENTISKTNLAHSMGTVWLHLDSKSGIPHLHAVYCRVDENGKTNDDHNIHLRALWAAEQVAISRGWETASDVHEVRIAEARETCEQVLAEMEEWSWSAYKNGLAAKGYALTLRTDCNGTVVGYTIAKGNIIHHASKLGTRRLTAAHIEATWRKMHPRKPTSQHKLKPVSRQFHVPMPTQKASTECTAPVATPRMKPLRDYATYRPGTSPCDIGIGGKYPHLYIPNVVASLFNDEFDYRFIENSVELCNMAMEIFAELYLAQHDAPASSGGGGSQSELPWREKDEDDMAWARRVVKFINSTMTIKPRSGRRR